MDEYKLYNGDCFDVLREMPDESVDMVFADPPYWTLNKWRSMGTTTRLGGHHDPAKRHGWYETIGPESVDVLLKEIFRLLKPNRHGFVMCDGQTLRYVLNAAAEYFSYFKPLVWDKVNPGMGYHLRACHEYIVMLDKGKNLICKDRRLKDIISIPSIRTDFPTQKPVELVELFVKNFTDGGGYVLDPFMGSGTTGEACIQTGRKFIGIEINPDYFKIAEARIQKAVDNFQNMIDFSKDYATT